MSIVVVGDLIVDKYVEVLVNRVSPEAPCLIGKDISKVNFAPGGAGNVVKNLVVLKKKEQINFVTAGSCFFPELFQGCSNIEFKKVHSESISEKTRFVDKKSRIQVFRYDKEDIVPKNTGDEFEEYKRIMESVNFREYNVCVIVDYMKGMIKGKNKFNFVGSKVNIISSKRKDVGNIVPRKPRGKEGKNDVNILVVNEDEYNSLTELFGYNYIVKTEGDRGITLIKCEDDEGFIDHKENEIEHFGGHKVDVFDVIGAGDVVTAYIAYHIEKVGFSEDSLKEACRIANIVAAKTVSRHGTSVVYEEDLEGI